MSSFQLSFDMLDATLDLVWKRMWLNWNASLIIKTGWRSNEYLDNKIDRDFILSSSWDHNVGVQYRWADVFVVSLWVFVMEK